MELVAPLISFNWTLVMVLITFVVVYLLVKKFFFEKIHNFMEAREQKVKDQFDSAEKAEKLAEEHLNEYKEKLDGIDVERIGMVKDAKTIADQQAAQIIEEANVKANEIVKQAEIQIERERELFIQTMRDQVAMLAVYAAEKIIGKQLDEQGQMTLIDDIIKQGKDEKWTH